jgi:hypothetical protein
MCYYSTHASEVIDAQAGDELQVRLHMHGSKCLTLADTKIVACLKPGTEVEISRIPFILRWTCKVKQGARALFTSAKSAAPSKRDCFILGDGQVLRLSELPHRLRLKVIAVPVQRPEESLDLKFRDAEREEELVVV